MSESGSSKRSQFAQTLVELLDDTGFYTREEWAGFLCISPSVISQWVNDKMLPRADMLAMVLDLLRLRGGEKAKEALKRFDHIAVLPAAEVSPLGARMMPNVASYVEANSFATLGSQLRDLSRVHQRAVLREGSWMAASDDLLNPWRAVDDQDWDYLLGLIPDGGRGRFWKAVFAEQRAAIAKAKLS
jgi:hypothetical protein